MKVERWGVFELTYEGKGDGNPFTDYEIVGVFSGAQEEKEVKGFYDGEGVYKIRFMPSYTGEYHYRVYGSFSEQEYEGSFLVEEAGEGNHGPVRVKDTYHFCYEDGKPYYSIGTTCYVWELQSDERIRETLESLEEAGFNKIRFCVFPKHYDYNLTEPRTYPYMGTPMDSSVLTKENFGEYTENAEGNHWDFTRFNPKHFQHIEKCLYELMDIGVEADIIIMHPYDRWGFSKMDRVADELYWNYLLTRFSAFRNVWWSLANEYDLMKHKTVEDWEALGNLLWEKDPYNHLRSIHNCFDFYDYTRPWITHCSIQRQDIYKTAELVTEWRETFHKPVVLDEIAYEGDIQHGWGNITAEEMLRRFWEAACRGGYPGHGETYLNQEQVLWWSHGGRLRGESWKRFRFLYEIMAQTPGVGLKEKKEQWDSVMAVPQEDELAEKTGYRLYYYSFMRPSFREFHFDDENLYRAEVIDTWNMTIQDMGCFQGKFKIALPGKQFMAIRIRLA